MNLIYTILLTFFSVVQNNSPEDLRNAYAKANSSAEATKNFIALAEKKSSADAAVAGYKAAAKIMEAKLTKDANRRKVFIKTGATQLETLVKGNPNLAELRVIRLSVQENIPKIVGYSKNMKEDKTFLLSSFHKQNAALKNYIKRFALQSKSFSAAEKSLLK